MDGDRTTVVPAYRAGVLHGLLETIEAHEQGAACLAAVDPERLEHVRQAFRSDWIPVTIGICLYESAFTAGGPELLMDIAKSNAVRQGKIAPIFRPLLRGSLNLFGDGPRSLFKSLSRALDVSTRHNGKIELLPGNEDSVMEYDWTGIPPQLWHDVFVIGQRGTSLGLLALLDLPGTCEADASRLQGEGHVRFRVAW